MLIGLTVTGLASRSLREIATHRWAPCRPPFRRRTRTLWRVKTMRKTCDCVSRA